MIKFEYLPASNGDCIFISINNENFILIDGGFVQTYNKHLKKKLKTISHNNKYLDLVVVTHVDSDHIRGVLKLLGGEYLSLVKRVWFNSGDILSKYFNLKIIQEKIELIDTQYTSENISIKEGIKLEDKLSKLNISNKDPIVTLNNHIINDINFTIISPDMEKLKHLNKEWNNVLEELKSDTSSNISSIKNDYDQTIEELIINPFTSDKSISNGSSIAFIMNYKIFNFLFLADAHINDIIDSLKKLGYSDKKNLKVEFVKLSHHGSKGNLNEEFLSLIDTDTYVISTKGSPVHNHPNKETLAKIIDFHQEKEQSCKFIFNYTKAGQLKTIFNELDFELSHDTFFNIEYNEEYNFYLYFPIKSDTGAIINYE